MELEQITKEEFKPSLSKKFFNAISKGILYATAPLLIASGGAAIVSGCGSEDNPPEKETTIGEVSIKSGKTNSQGQIFFTDQQTGEEVTVNIKDDYGTAVTNAPVAFFDGDGFETFQVNHPDYAPSLQIFSHNSSHTLSLTSGSMQFQSYTGSNNDNSKAAAKKFYNQMKSNSLATGCEFADEIADNFKERGLALAKICDKFEPTGSCDKLANWGYKGLDALDYILDKLEEYGFIESQCVAYRTFANEDVSQWNIGPSLSLRIYECMTSIPPEDCNNGIDDDCDHKIDYQDSDCDSNPTCQDECDYKGQKECSDNKIITCTNNDNDDCLEWADYQSCGSDQKCEEGECVTQYSDGSREQCDCCISDKDCAENLVCIQGFSQCRPTDNPCLEDSDCDDIPYSTSCIQNYCVILLSCRSSNC